MSGESYQSLAGEFVRDVLRQHQAALARLVAEAAVCRFCRSAPVEVLVLGPSEITMDDPMRMTWTETVWPLCAECARRIRAVVGPVGSG